MLAGSRARRGNSVAYDRYGVVKLQDDPDVFWIIFVDSNAAKGSPFMKTSDDLDEAQVRAELTKMGLAEDKINGQIAAARADWDQKKKAKS